MDLNNGPKSRVISITHVSADEVLRCQVEFEICKLECVRDIPDGLSNQQTNLAPAVLSNRWSVNDSIDKNFMTTRTYTGRLRLASLGVDPNDFRSWIVPSVYPGFHRERMDFAITTDGLNVDYTVVDKEIVFSAPAPATTWKFSHTETTGDGKSIVGELSITLGGDRTVSRTLLIAMEAAIVDNVLYAYSQANPGTKLSGQFIEELSFTDEVSDDGVLMHAHCRVRRSPVTVDQNGEVAYQTFKFVFAQSLGLSLDQLQNFQATLNAIQTAPGRTYGDDYYPYDPNFSRGNREEGENSENVGVEGPELFGPLSSVAALACYLQSPCSGTHQIGSQSQTGQSLDGGLSDRQDSTGPASPAPPYTEINVTVVTQLPPDQNPPYSVGQASHDPNHGDSLWQMWTKGQQEARHHQKPGSRIALPIAAPPNIQSQPQPSPPTPSGPQFDPNNPPPAAPTPWYWPKFPTWRDRIGPGTQNDPTTPYVPVAGGPTSHAIVSLTPPTFYRTVRMAYERVGAPVQLPPPVDILDPSGQTPNQWLMSYTLIPQPVDLTSDGQMIFRAAAEYEYVYDAPPSLSNLPIGITPWLNLDYQGTGPNTFGQPQDDSGDLVVMPA